MNKQAALAALEWHLDMGVDEALSGEPVDATVMPSMPQRETPIETPTVSEKPNASLTQTLPTAAPTPLGASEARKESLALAKTANTLEDLREAIASFDGIPLKKTATNLVYCDGNNKAPIMIVGEAPGADEDRLGKPFVGPSGQLLDKILSCLDLSRTEEDVQRAVYLSNILNWRPPGNRTPSPGEVEASLPFIEKHIALVKPKLLILVGGVSTKALLNTTDGISRLRGKFHNYTPLTSELFETTPDPIPTLATYHPDYLLRTPSQKKRVWQDMLILQEKRKELGLLS